MRWLISHLKVYCCVFFAQYKVSEILPAGLLRMITRELEPNIFLFRAVSWTSNFKRGRRNNKLLQPSLCVSAALLLKTTLLCIIAVQLITTVILYHSGITWVSISLHIIFLSNLLIYNQFMTRDHNSLHPSLTLVKVNVTIHHHQNWTQLAVDSTKIWFTFSLIFLTKKFFYIVLL